MKYSAYHFNHLRDNNTNALKKTLDLKSLDSWFIHEIINGSQIFPGNDRIYFCVEEG